MRTERPRTRPSLVTCALVAAAWTLPAGIARAQEQPPPEGPPASQEPRPGEAAPDAKQQPPAEGAPAAQQPAPDAEKPPTIDESIEAGESQAKEPRRELVKFNEYRGPYFTLRVGGGLLYDLAAYSQDAESKQQMELENQGKLRDFRVTLKGSFPKIPWLTWSTGIMYDGPTGEWLFRETGVMISVPALSSHFFIGRTKEGFSLNKVMVGYAGWTMERSTINDASIPILADGIKWLGYLPKPGILWNIGYYNDLYSKDQAFSTYHSQFVARLAWLPVASEKTGTLLHLGLNFRYGVPEGHELRLRSRPEAFASPYFIETDVFPTARTRMASAEAYYRPGPWLFGMEYFVQRASSGQAGNPLFHGGEAVVTWLVTGETRAYNTRGGFFNAISPTKTLFQGGPGAVELVGRISYIDLDDGTVSGGRFLRFTPMVNWHLSDHVRLEFAYGYGLLDRFGLKGGTQFLQSRIQLSL
jgi:phosphate-selective porin OprO and OprP